MSFCGLKQAMLLCGGNKKSISNNTTIKGDHCIQSKLKSNQNNDKDLNIDIKLSESTFNEDLVDGEITLQFSSTLNNSNLQENKINNKKLLNMSRNAAIIYNENDVMITNLYKLLSQASLSKSANIPMIVVKTFIPDNDDLVSDMPAPQPTPNKFAFKLFANITKHKQFKQIEIHRGMTINALFSRDNWLYIKTAENESGYVPLDTCKPVVKRMNNNENNNKTCFIDATNVSLLDISNQKLQQQQDNVIIEDEMYFNEEDENLSELEFSQYDNKNISNYMKLKQQLNNTVNDEQSESIRLFKIKNYFKSLEIETNLLDNLSTSSSSIASSSKQRAQRNSIAIDSGYSDTDSNIISTKQISQSYELLSQCTKTSIRRGIKTNGSICSISPNSISTGDKAASMNSLVIDDQQCEIININNQQSISVIEDKCQYKPTKTNLSTIIEQSYNSTCELQRAASSSILANNSLFHVNKADLSNLQTVDSVKSSTMDLTANTTAASSSTSSSCYKQIFEDYEPLFMEDLAVFKGEYVTILEDNNPEWCYVISQNGKGYIPRNCIQF